ncbi:Ubiquitin-conjugating enzyme E2 [Penicillium robsamsonii]|uniref:Ubiquitin-conjugating enzyme E2 n=1 Tax=Penicillium robsamsonii TaxID=1792511 RepID=UPI002547AFE0|nr:Ubiquitin-conjugating enzyme E2 [Penicillium robsamsonii]KAJ5834985.1 Ubiquitin-conjugating enzyme E2 [Penicillium robsamsonii]
MGSIKRISKELAELTESPPEGITVELADESNVYEWRVKMDGPEGSPFHVCQNMICLPLSSPSPTKVSNRESPNSNLPVQLQQTAFLTSWQTTQNGKFLVKLSLPTEYPFKPPTVSFATKIYHPNVTNDDKGSMCLGMLRADEWKPSSKIAAVLQFARQLLAEPMPDDAVEGRIAEQYKNDRARYEEVAREWTRKYAC